jgi:hypothetical protein
MYLYIWSMALGNSIVLYTTKHLELPSVFIWGHRMFHRTVVIVEKQSTALDTTACRVGASRTAGRMPCHAYINKFFFCD